MYKTCSRCGGIHKVGYVCKAGYKTTYKKTEERSFRNKYKWKVKAEQIKKEASYLCEVCKDKGQLTYKTLGVHHITPLAEDLSRGLDNYNLIVLCREHHEEAENKTLTKEYLEDLAKKREQDYLETTPPTIS